MLIYFHVHKRKKTLWKCTATCNRAKMHMDFVKRKKKQVIKKNNCNFTISQNQSFLFPQNNPGARAKKSRIHRMKS